MFVSRRRYVLESLQLGSVVMMVYKPRHDLRYPSVHFSRPYRSVKGEGGETLTDSISTCLFVDCFLMPTFCHFCRSFMPLWGEREMVRFAARRTADDDPPSHL